MHLCTLNHEFYTQNPTVNNKILTNFTKALLGTEVAKIAPAAATSFN